MDKNMQSIISQAEKLYNAKLVNKNTLGNSMNIILEMAAEKPMVIRVSEFNENKVNHIAFELQWMSYLSSEMGNVAQPLLNKNNKLNEIITCDKKYIICAFEKASGNVVNANDSGEYNESLFFELGRIMGCMHRLTKKYNGCDESNADEFAWDKSWSFWLEYNAFIDDDVHFYEKKYIEKMRMLHKSKETYGIIHSDIQQLNFFVDNGHITLFDFDDCEFNWYANDIAITLYQFVQQSKISYNNKKEREDFAETFLTSFLEGYISKNSISEYWILMLDMFMKYRRTTTYKFITNVFKDKINPHEAYTIWLKNEILHDTSFVEIDYRKIINSLRIE